MTCIICSSVALFLYRFDFPIFLIFLQFSAPENFRAHWQRAYPSSIVTRVCALR